MFVVGERGIVMSESVRMFVWPLVYITNQTLLNFLCMLPVALAQFSSGGVAILHVFPVFCIFMYWHIQWVIVMLLVTGTSWGSIRKNQRHLAVKISCREFAIFVAAETQEAVDKWQLSLMKMERHVWDINSVAGGGSVARRHTAESRCDCGYLWILYFLLRRRRRRRCLGNQFAPYLIGAWRTNIMMLSPTLSPLTKRLPSPADGARQPLRGGRRTSPYVMPFRLRSSGVLTTPPGRGDVSADSVETFYCGAGGGGGVRMVLPGGGERPPTSRRWRVVDKLSALWRRRRRAALSGLMPSPRPRDLFVASSTTCAPIGAAASRDAAKYFKSCWCNINEARAKTV